MHGLQTLKSSAAVYSMLVEPQPAGPAIGTFAGLDIAEAVVDQFGRRFAYAGVLSRRRDGQYDLAALKTGEFIVEPGLVYSVTIPGPKLLSPGVAGCAPPGCLPRFSAAESPAQPGEDRRVVAQLAAALMLFLTGALAVQVVLLALRAG